MTRCPACGFPGEFDGPAHAYLSPTPACWARYGEVLAREYSDAEYWRFHRLLTDAYCGQHSIGEDRRARQSLYIHLAGLVLHFERAETNATVIAFFKTAIKSGHDFPHLGMPQANLSISIAEVHKATDAAAHGKAVEQYAHGVYEAWSQHHDCFRAMIYEFGGVG